MKREVPEGSIIAHLKTDEFARIKIGVGSKPDGGDLVNHVLGRFSKDDSAVIDDAVKRGAKAAAAIVATGAKEAMNEFNFVPKDEKSREVQ